MAITPLSLKLPSSLPPVAGTSDADASNPAGGFAGILKGLVNQAAGAQTNAHQMSLAAAQGENVPLQDVVAALGRAETTLQTLVSVRDKAIEAYQEILRMPI